MQDGPEGRFYFALHIEMEIKEMSENLLIVKVGSNVLANSDRTRLQFHNFRNIAEDINSFEAQQDDVQGSQSDKYEQAHTLLISSGAFLASRAGGGVTNAHLEKMDAEERAKYKQQAIGAKEHRILEGAWADSLTKRSMYSTIGALDLVTQSQRDAVARRMYSMLGMGIIGIYNNDDQQSLKELDDVVTLHGERYHIMADNDYTTLSVARLAMGAGLLGGRGQWLDMEKRHEATVVFLTTTDGVLEDVERADSTFETLTTDDARLVAEDSLEHTTSCTSNGGMYSKLTCAATIADETNARVVIAGGKGRFALAKAIAGESGTEIYANQ